MGFRVAKASAAIAVLLVSLSGIALSRSLDWELPPASDEEGSYFIGPQLPKLVVPVSANETTKHKTRNADLAEALFSFLPGLDISDFGKPMQPGIVANTVLVEETDASATDENLRLAYDQYLNSLMAAEELLSTQAAPLVRQIELARRGDAEQNWDPQLENSSEAIAQSIPAEIESVHEIIDVPFPHVWQGEARVSSSNAVAYVEQNMVQVSVDSVLGVGKAPIAVPHPYPASARPVLAVRPASVHVVQPARDVSVDFLVHADAQGSWPRRLDQIQALNGVNIFMQNWSQNRTRRARNFGNFPYGYVIVGANK